MLLSMIRNAAQRELDIQREAFPHNVVALRKVRQKR